MIYIFLILLMCRNGGRPDKGIETHKVLQVHMASPLRRNGGRPEKGIETAKDFWEVFFDTSRNGGNPEEAFVIGLI